jgi:hypothetical protein
MFSVPHEYEGNDEPPRYTAEELEELLGEDSSEEDARRVASRSTGGLLLRSMPVFHFGSEPPNWD